MKAISGEVVRWSAIALCLLVCAGPPLLAQSGNPVKLQIKADQITAHMPPTFHGLMTEEINYAFEGGLYAELIRNRNFKETAPARNNRQNPDQSTPAKEAKDLVHWSLMQMDGGAGSMTLDTGTPLNAAVPATLKLTISQASGNQSVGVANDGFWGIPVKPNAAYKADVLRQGLDRLRGRRDGIDRQQSRRRGGDRPGCENRRQFCRSTSSRCGPEM